MKTLIVAGDFVNRLALEKRLKQHGDVHIAMRADEALQAMKSLPNNIDRYTSSASISRSPEWTSTRRSSGSGPIGPERLQKRLQTLGFLE